MLPNHVKIKKNILICCNFNRKFFIKKFKFFLLIYSLDVENELKTNLKT